MTTMSDSHHCDWCLRPMRQPDEWTAGMTDEQRRACCWGRPSDARCGEIHETEAWPKMLAEVARLRGLLREVEWNSGFWGDDSGCSICGAPKTSGHAIDCRLAAVLKVGHG